MQMYEINLKVKEYCLYTLWRHIQKHYLDSLLISECQCCNISIIVGDFKITILRLSSVSAESQNNKLSDNKCKQRQVTRKSKKRISLFNFNKSLLPLYAK